MLTRLTRDTRLAFARPPSTTIRRFVYQHHISSLLNAYTHAPYTHTNYVQKPYIYEYHTSLNVKSIFITSRYCWWGSECECVTTIRSLLMRCNVCVASCGRHKSQRNARTTSVCVCVFVTQLIVMLANDFARQTATQVKVTFVAANTITHNQFIARTYTRTTISF